MRGLPSLKLPPPCINHRPTMKTKWMARRYAVSVGTLALDPLRLLTWPTSHSALLSGILTLSLTSRCESTPDQPLFYPCMCKGSIRYVHQVCRLLLRCRSTLLVRSSQWLNSFQWCSYTRTRSASRSGSSTATRHHVNFVNTPSAFNLVRTGPALQAYAFYAVRVCTYCVHRSIRRQRAQDPGWPRALVRCR